MRNNRAMLLPAIPLAVVFAFATGVTVVHAQTLAADPPSRVGRTALLLGTVSFHTADQTAWTAATLNYPVTTGNAFWTQPSSAAEIDVGDTQLALDQSTEFNIDTLDDHDFQATEAQGAIFLRLRNVPAGDSYRITTPRGVAVITQAGAYEIVAGDADHPTTVTVLEGAARIDSTNASLTLTVRQTGRIDGTSNFAASVGPAVIDPFVTARLAAEQRAARAPQFAAPPVVAQMTGGYALNSVGSWAQSRSYGQIWYPPVSATWVPYRDGHWGYVAPWGWTWIDDATWGFAPFHYGRWVREGTRWGWIPAERAEQQRSRAAPVYAPALVTFLGVGIAVGGNQHDRRDGQNAVGWIPLGPREAYVPPYHTSDRYVHAVNSNNIAITTNVTNVTTVNNYVNRSAATMVPAAAMTSSQPIAPRAQPVGARVLAGARTERAIPVRPTAATLGVTPAVAQRLMIAPAPIAAKPAPGPVLPPPQPAVAHPAAAHPAAAKPGVVALPTAAALPMLRPPTPIAPAHPKAGGTSVGAPVEPQPARTPPHPVGPVPVPAASAPGVPPVVAPVPPALHGAHPPGPPAHIVPPAAPGVPPVVAPVPPALPGAHPSGPPAHIVPPATPGVPPVVAPVLPALHGAHPSGPPAHIVPPVVAPVPPALPSAHPSGPPAHIVPPAAPGVPPVVAPVPPALLGAHPSGPPAHIVPPAAPAALAPAAPPPHPNAPATAPHPAAGIPAPASAAVMPADAHPKEPGKPADEHPRETGKP